MLIPFPLILNTPILWSQRCFFFNLGVCNIRGKGLFIAYVSIKFTFSIVHCQFLLVNKCPFLLFNHKSPYIMDLVKNDLYKYYINNIVTFFWHGFKWLYKSCQITPCNVHGMDAWGSPSNCDPENPMCGVPKTTPKSTKMVPVVEGPGKCYFIVRTSKMWVCVNTRYPIPMIHDYFPSKFAMWREYTMFRHTHVR